MKDVLAQNIHFLELLAAIILLVIFIVRNKSLVKGKTVVIKIDNSVAIS